MPTDKEAPYKKRQREAREGRRGHTYWPSAGAGSMSWKAIANARAARTAAKGKAAHETPIEDPGEYVEPEPADDDKSASE